MGSHEVSDRIGEKAVRFVFLRLSPRVEIPTLIARIREVLGESVAVSDARTVLGIFDVLVEYRVDTIAPDFSKLGTLPGVTNSAEFICYEWVAERGQAPGSLPSDYPLSVFTLLRLHSDALSQGLHAERELVERIEGTLSLREGRPYSVFGSLGPAELVVVTYGRSMVDLAAGLRHLSLAIHRDGDQPLVSKSLSFVCASSIVFESPTITRSEEAMAFWERLASERALLADSGGAIPHLLVDTDASKHGEITRWVGDRCGSSGPFGTVDTVLGLHDLLVRPGRQANWRDFLWGCLELRRIFSDVIQATTLVIGLPHPTLPTGRASSETIPEERSSGPLTVDLTATQADAMIGTLGEPLGEAVVNAIYTYNSMVHGDPQSHGLRDIHPFVAELCRSATEPKADRQKRLKLGYCVELLRSGLHHHSAGAFHGIDRPAWRIIAVQGGLQRVTVGITHALRRLIMRHFGERWEGFATISTAHRGFYNALGVINIPINAFGDISHLWTLLHEIGHLASEGFWEKTGLTKAVDDFKRSHAIFSHSAWCSKASAFQRSRQRSSNGLRPPIPSTRIGTTWNLPCESAASGSNPTSVAPVRRK